MSSSVYTGDSKKIIRTSSQLPPKIWSVCIPRLSKQVKTNKKAKSSKKSSSTKKAQQ